MIEKWLSTAYIYLRVVLEQSCFFSIIEVKKQNHLISYMSKIITEEVKVNHSNKDKGTASECKSSKTVMEKDSIWKDVPYIGYHIPDLIFWF